MKLNKFYLECTICGNCCSSTIDTASTFLYIDDIVNISKALSISQFEFLNRYCKVYQYNYIKEDECVLASYRIVLKKDPSCCFLNKNKCRIHDFKPFICKHGPFLPSIINSEIESRNWLEKCPGLYQPHIKTEQKNNRIKYLTKIKMLQKKKEKDYFNLLFSDEENIYSEFIKTNNISKLINIKM